MQNVLSRGSESGNLGKHSMH